MTGTSTSTENFFRLVDGNIKYSFSASFTQIYEPNTKLSKLRNDLNEVMNNLMTTLDNEFNIIHQEDEDLYELQDMIIDLPEERKTDIILKKSFKRAFSFKDSYKHKESYNKALVSLSRKVKFPRMSVKKVIMEPKIIGIGGFGQVKKGKYLATYIAKKKMLNFEEESFLREYTYTYWYRNTRSPTVMSAVEEISYDPHTMESVLGASVILEFISGYTLRQRLNRLNKYLIVQPVNEILFLMYMIDLAKALEFLTGKRLIHRDLKPENILITDNFEFKLIDFGISKMSNNTYTFTARGKGTVLYEPPENVTCDLDQDEDVETTNFGYLRKLSKKYDTWAFGLIMNEVFGSEIPWGEEFRKNPNLITLALLNKRKFPVSKSIKNRLIANLIERCTEIHPRNRPDIKVIIKELVNILELSIKTVSLNNDIRKLFDDRVKSKLYILKS